MDKFSFEIRPFPNEKFTSDAHITCVGAPVKLREVIIGHVSGSRIEDGELILTVDQP